MIDISPEIFEVAYQKFNNLFEGEITKAKIELKDHPLMSKHENYKYEIINDAKEALLLKIWKESDIGSGRILGYIKDAINVKSNNLIDWRKKDDFKKLAANLKNEKFLYDFFKSKIDDGNAFDNFVEIGFSYQLIAYLYFIKNYQRYIPISQEQFDKIFSSLSIDFKTSHNISWENYLQFNEIIKQFRRMLSDRYNNVSLLDAHSFLWIYGFQLDNEKGEAESEKLPKSEIEEKSEIHKPEHKPKLDTYQPKKVVDLHSLKEESSEIDYLENHRKLMEIGELAERIVYESERNFLEQHSPELVKKVRLVSNNPKLGFDILSYEINGDQKQIEVKAISVNNGNKSFILTRNELSKAKVYSNYYIYCVTDINSDNPKILRIKNPDFTNNEDFLIEPLIFKITFE